MPLVTSALFAGVGAHAPYALAATMVAAVCVLDPFRAAAAANNKIDVAVALTSPASISTISTSKVAETTVQASSRSGATTLLNQNDGRSPSKMSTPPQRLRHRFTKGR
jgi:hypothetical protein